MAKSDAAKDLVLSGESSFLNAKYYSELVRLATWLLTGVLALMTFLLTVGYQKPHHNFSYALYTAIVALGLNLIFYLVGNLAHDNYLSNLAKAADNKDKDKADAVASSKKNAGTLLKVVRVLQQVLFVVAVVAVAALAIYTANFFFAIATAATAPQ